MKENIMFVIKQIVQIFHSSLGLMYHILMVRPNNSDSERKTCAENAIKHLGAWEKSSTLTYKSRSLRIILIVDCLVADNADLAVFHASKIRELISLLKDKYLVSEIHVLHTALGVQSLSLGNIKEAKKHLLESAKIRANNVISVYGPSMFLAEKLLHFGQTETVLKYLEMCKSLWNTEEGRMKLTSWIAQVEAGKNPDFGLSLYVT